MVSVPLNRRLPARAAGFSLLELILVIALALFIGAWVAAMLMDLPNSFYTTNLPNRQEPTSVIVSGPATLNPGRQGTYTLRITYPEPIHPTSSFVVVAEIYEDDFGDVLLDRLVRVRIPGGRNTGTGTFTLTCVDPPPPDGDYIIRGDNGFNTLDDVWEVFGYVPDQVTSESDEGPNYDVVCEEP